MYNSWVDTSPGPSSPGGTTVGGGGQWSVQSGTIHYRDPLDARRAHSGSLGEAQYPDGYLGTIIDRHQDKLLAKVQERLTDRSYQRGVHVGSKIGQRAYYWDDKINPTAGLKRQAAYTQSMYTMETARFVPSGNPVERLAHESTNQSITGPEMMEMARKYGVNPAINPIVIPDPDRRARMQKMLPNYV